MLVPRSSPDRSRSVATSADTASLSAPVLLSRPRMAGDEHSRRGLDREVEREVHRELPRDRSDPAGAGARVVEDGAGTYWQVREVSGRSVPGARGESCLVFESEFAIRRVWHYPAQWRELPAPDLIAVSWNR